MARSSSPVFNEAPPSDQSEPMVTKTSTSSTAPADASVSSAPSTSTAPTASTVVASTPSPTPSNSDCLKTSNGVASPSSVDASPEVANSSSAPRYGRVPPVGLQSVKSSLTFRKSCLKRSKSSLCPPSPFLEAETLAKTVELPLARKEDEKPLQKNRRRCWECKVKVGLTAVKCRCDYTFCNKHRYAEEHKCVFNFKTAGKRKLEEDNPVVVPSKVARIN